jgi:hypothetical protein
MKRINFKMKSLKVRKFISRITFLILLICYSKNSNAQTNLSIKLSDINIYVRLYKNCNCGDDGTTDNGTSYYYLSKKDSTILYLYDYVNKTKIKKTYKIDYSSRVHKVKIRNRNRATKIVEMEYLLASLINHSV